ncbi:hypothetical protein [Pedobacter alpinus]|uniref:CcmD family protein n=1 Tax=Pedobacter alpinus TaxID=1590643 RepID=A0ABW5TTM9_9SPHI
MKKTIKASLLLIALVLTQTLTFAAEVKTTVYASQAPLSDLSSSELLNSTWVWALIVIVGIVLILAFFAAQEKSAKDPKHAI